MYLLAVGWSCGKTRLRAANSSIQSPQFDGQGGKLHKLLIAFLLALVSAQAVAQKNELSITFAAQRTSDQTLTFPAPVACPFISNPPCAFTGEKLIDQTRFGLIASYARRIVRTGAADLYIEAPFFVIPSHDIRNVFIANIPLAGPVPAGTALFITPSLRAKLLPESTISPFVSVGGGLAHYGSVDSGGNNVGAPPATNSGALQFGGGIDVKTPVPALAIRAEIRDVWTGSRFGSTDFSVTRPQNVFIGVGLVFRP